MVLKAYPVVTSYWGDQPEPQATLSEDLTADVVVVGAGLAGLSSAYYLKQAERDLSVVVLESRHVGYGASGRNFGSVPQLGRSDPDLLEDLLGPDEARFVIDHQARMLEDFEALLSDEEVSCDYERSNVLLIGRDQASVADLDRLWNSHARFGYPSQRLTADELRQCVELDSFGGLSCARQAFVDPLALSRGLARAARSRGADIRESSPVTALSRSGGGVVVTAPEGSVTARHCVLATNAFSPSLGTGEGWFQPAYTYVLATVPLNEDERGCLGWDTSRHRQAFDVGRIGVYYYMQLRATGQFLIGGGIAPESRDGRTFPAHDAVAEYRRIHEEMVRRFPALALTEIRCAWGGPIARTPTGLPTTAWVDDGVLLNAGYNGRGVLMATLSGRVVANLIGEADRVEDDYDRYARDLLAVEADQIRVGWS